MILIVVPCSATKHEVELFNVGIDFLSKLDSVDRDVLVKGRQIFSKYITGTKHVTALSLYNGYLYKKLNKSLIYDRLIKSKLDFIIISAVYGLTHALEKIKSYNLHLGSKVELNGKVDLVLNVWLSLGLHKVLANYIINNDFEEVYMYTTSRSKYLDVFSHVVKELRSRKLTKRIYLVKPRKNIKSIVSKFYVLAQHINSIVQEEFNLKALSQVVVEKLS